MKLTYKNNIVEIFFEREEKLNSFNKKFFNDLEEKLNEIEKNKKVNCIIFSGNERAFSAGLDLSEILKFKRKDFKYFKKIFEKIENSEKITIAAISGYCLGAGLELALHCDFRIVIKSCKIGLPEIKIGLIPGLKGFEKIEKINYYKAKELILTGKFLSEEEALKIGLVNKIVESFEEVENFAEEILKNSLSALKIAKKVFNKKINVEEGFMRCLRSKDAKERIKNFLSKR